MKQRAPRRLTAGALSAGLALLLCAPGCRARPETPAPAATAPASVATAPATTVTPASASPPAAASSPVALPGPLIITRAQPLKSLLADRSLTEKARLAGRAPGESLRFVDISRNISDIRPGLVYSAGGAEVALSFEGGDFAQLGWVHVAESGGRIVGVLDCQVEAPGWELELVASEDGGRSWHHTGTIKKPYYMSNFEGLSLTASGEGELVVHLEDDYGAGMKTGFYRYPLKNFGPTTAGPAHSATFP
jgi:hypothetical protein